MGKRGFILVNGYKLIPSIEYCAKRLIEEFSLVGVQLDLIKSTEVLVALNRNEISLYSSKYSFCIFLDKDYYISTMLEMANIRVFNSAKSIEICDDKMKTYLALTNQGILMPKTISGPLNYSGVNSPDFINSLLTHLNLPIVVKENFGSQGSKVYLAKTKDELIKLEENITSHSRLFQELIQSSWGEDYRLIIIGNEYVAGMKRSSQNGDFRSNINLCGKGEAISMPKDYIELAIKVSKILGLDYCGVDILKSDNGPVLCEVNSNAFFMKIEEVTKINVAAKYRDHILSLLK